MTDKATRDERIPEAVTVHRYTLHEMSGHGGLLYSAGSVIATRLDEGDGPYKGLTRLSLGLVTMSWRTKSELLIR